MPSNKASNAHVASASGLNNPERQMYLTAIDRLRELNINESISLPQLVVVGDQSSGKSSLLEGISSFGFPVSGDLCTRFATQIVLRRGSERYVKLAIIPGPSSQDDEAAKEQYAAFEKVIEGDSDEIDFSAVVTQASFLMGLPATLEESSEPDVKRFSDDLLKVEISGPDHPNLSVVDVPGLFHNPTKYQTEEDRQIIRKLISRFIEDQRTIILAVLDARNNLANQEVFELARTSDPDGSRTVGVITKCDAVQAGDEQTVLQIANNEIEYLNHGWFTVRNRTTKEINDGVTIEQRHRREEDFFKLTEPWNKLPRERCGVSALKTFLGDLLYQHIRREFPRVAEEIDKLHADAKNEIEALGLPRHNAIEQRQYLIKIATSIQKLVEDSLRGNYDESLKIKLRAKLRIANDEFERVFRHHGHKMAFKNEAHEADPEYTQKGEQTDVLQWIGERYRDSRGAELPGTVNPALLEVLFREFTEGWEALSVEYVGNAEKHIRDFTDAVHERTVPDPQVCSTLLRHHYTRGMEVGASARAELTRFLHDERSQPLQTVNHYFTQTLQSIRQARVTHRFKNLGFNTKGNWGVDMADLLKAANLSNEEQAINDIHDSLKAYYKVAQKRFMDNVVNGVVERHLVGSNGVLRMFTPEYVGGLDDNQLSCIAAEPPSTSRQREELARRLATYAEALKIIAPLR